MQADGGPFMHADHAATGLSRRRMLQGALLALLAGAVPGSRAQGYPSRAIRLVVPWGPGGLVDTGGRVVGDALQKALGQSTAVENVPGAAGTLGAQQVAKAAPDGHTLLVATSSLAIDVGGGRSLAFDPATDLVPTALIGDSHSVVIVPAASPLQTLADLVAVAKARPGALSYGTPGIGSPAHLFTELFLQVTGVTMLHVPYARASALNDLMGGRLDVMFATVPVALPQVAAGTVRALAVTGAKRDAALPRVPTAVEAGVPRYEAGQWVGLFAPARTPAEVVARLNAEISRALSAPDTASYLRSRGLEPRTATPAEFAAVFAADVRKWGEVIRRGRIELK